MVETLKGTIEQHLLLGELSEEFPRCGCGDPDLVFEALRDTLLELTAGSSGNSPGYDGTVASIIHAEQDGPAYWLWMYVVDKMGLTDHGTSVRGSWLTDKGREVLGALNDCGCDHRSWHYLAAENCIDGSRSLVPLDNDEASVIVPTDEQWKRAKAIMGQKVP